LAALVFLLTRSKAWSIGLLIGLWIHVLSDLWDTVGVMLFFPFTTKHFAAGAWAYHVETGRLQDAASYYSGLGLVWDAFWLVLALACWRILRREYFLRHVTPVDGFWSFAGRHLPEAALLALYRGALFFGVCRFAGWMIWAHVLHDYPFDLSWGGPGWADAERLP